MKIPDVIHMYTPHIHRHVCIYAYTHVYMHIHANMPIAMHTYSHMHTCRKSTIRNILARLFEIVITGEFLTLFLNKKHYETVLTVLNIKTNL